MSKNSKISSSFLWKLLERFGVQGIQFVLQMVLARLLSADHYGVMALMFIFINLANVFIQKGFNTALIQNKDVTEEDYSSVFWVSLGITVVLYGMIYFAAPAIAAFYRMPDVVAPLRVLSLSLFPGVVNSIQLAKVSREMDFKKVFYSNVIGILLAGIVGIGVALMGGGLWALVIQNLLNITTASAVMLFTVNWFPKLVCNLQRIAELFSFGWKLLVAGLLNMLEESLDSLVIGKKYTSSVLGYYNRGMQFPQFFIYAISGAMESVLLPSMSSQQDDRMQVKELTRNSILLGSYALFPMMAGLACVASPLIRLLLTDKWLPAVPYMQIWCFCFSFYSIFISNLQAINSVGRSDWFLRLEIVKKIYSIALLMVAVVFFDTPMAIAMMGAVTAGLDWYVNSFPNKKLIGYPFWEQVADLLPVLLLTSVMCVAVMLVGYGCKVASLPDIVTLILQVLTGVGSYVLLSIVVKPYPYRMVMKLAEDVWMKGKS